MGKHHEDAMWSGELMRTIWRKKATLCVKEDESDYISYNCFHNPKTAIKDPKLLITLLLTTRLKRINFPFNALFTAQAYTNHNPFIFSYQTLFSHSF
jgi:hypothetical protein